MNNFLLLQIKKYFGSVDELPAALTGFIQDINGSYKNFEEEIESLQNSNEINSRELSEAFQSSKKWEAIISASPDGIGVITLEGRIQYASDKLAIMYGYTVEQKDSFVDHSIFDFIDPSNHELLMKNFQKLIRGESDLKITEYLAIKEDQTRFYVDVNSTIIFDSKGDTTGILFITRDITERKHAEEAIINERALFRTIIDLIPDGVYVKDIHGKKILANPKEVQFSGKESEEELIGKTDFNLYPDIDAQRGLSEDQQVIKTGKPILDIEGTLIDSDGQIHRLLCSKVPLRNMHGRITGLVGVTHDVSVRRMIEEKLQESEANFRTFFESMDDMLFVANQQGDLFYANGSFSQKLGYSIGELQSLHMLDITAVEDRTQAEQIFTAILEGKRDFSQLPLVRKNGSYVPVETRVWYGKWDGKEAIFGLSKDLSAEKESLEKFNTIFDHNPALMAITTIPENVFVEVNQVLLTSTGYSREELIGKSSGELGLFPDANRLSESEADFELKGFLHNRELKLRTKSGVVLDGLFSGEIIESQGKKYFLTVMVDITESKKLQEEIKLQNDFYNIASKVSERLIQTNSDQLEYEIYQSLETLGVFNDVDRTNIFEIDIEKNEISNTYEWCAKDIASHRDSLQNLSFSTFPRWKEAFLKNEYINIAWVGNLPEEHHFEKLILEPQGIRSLLAVPMFYGTSLIGFVSFDSVVEKKEWNEQIIILLKIYAGILGGVIYKKKMEDVLLKAKQDADMASKAKSEFLANMSHEIRTPLNGVIGFTDLLLKTPLNKIQQQYAENVNTSGFSLLGIINDILDFSKIEAGKMELDFIKTDLIELAEQTSDIIKYHASQKGLELLLNLQIDLPRFILADSTRLKQILINLLGNAIKFTGDGEVELKITFEIIDETSGEFTFSVRDTGIGINKDQQKKLFKAFSQADSSTTRKFGGTGLGLAISNVLAEKMGSKINIDSEPGKGSNFFFTIKTEYEIGEKLHAGSIADIHRVLVIDDNDNNRMILEHTLKNWGIEFVGIDNGYSALKLIESSNPFDVIIVDYHMPYLNGIDTIKRIREQLDLSPERLPVILLHSSSDDIGLYEDCKRLGVRFNLTKPVKSQELLQYLKNIHTPHISAVEISQNYSLKVNEVPDRYFSPVILVAEDVYLNMVLVTTIIKQMIPNVTILEAKNGIEAFDISVAKKPDLVLMDVQMPEMSGIEATVKIRAFEKETGNSITIIALTAGAIKGEREKCLEAGMDDFLTKPIDQVALGKILDAYILPVSHYANTSMTTIPINNESSLHFDKESLMVNIGHSQAVFDELLEVVPIQFSADLALLDKAMKELKLTDIRKAAHSIKGAALNMCFLQLANIAKEIEMGVENDRFNNFDSLYNDLISEWKELKIILEISEN